MSDYKEQTTRVSGGGVGSPMLGVRNDTPGDLSNGNGNYAIEQFDSAGAIRATEEGGKATYYATSQFTCDSTATDIAMFPGAAGVTAKLQFVMISSVATARANGNLNIIRRKTALDSGGTAVAANVAQADIRDAAAAVAPKHFTGHPTSLGTASGTLVTTQFIQPALATDNLIPTVLIDLRQFNGGKCVRVQGATDSICINVPAALGGSGNVWNITWCWTEEPTTA